MRIRKYREIYIKKIKRNISIFHIFILFILYNITCIFLIELITIVKQIHNYYLVGNARSSPTFNEQSLSNDLVCAAWNLSKKRSTLPVLKKRSRNSCVLSFPRKNSLCVLRTQVIVFPTCMVDGSSLLRLLPVDARMTLA